MNYKIIRYEFITNEYPIEMKYVHWSRMYEWKYVLDVLKTINPNSIHNTACGGLNSGDCLHLTFCKDINVFGNRVIHSDVWGRDNYIGIKNKPEGDNFIFYDITTDYIDKFDVVLNISTIEHLPQSQREIAIKSLYNQVNIGGHLILTFDYPDVDLNEMEKIFKIQPQNFNKKIMHNNLSVVLLHLIKII